jgi:hypothetical protein
MTWKRRQSKEEEPFFMSKTEKASLYQKVYKDASKRRQDSTSTTTENRIWSHAFKRRKNTYNIA